jgi:DNA polymerase III subunit delta'
MGISNGVKWDTFGHQNVKAVLNKQLESGRFPHAYLFVGPEGLGKKMLALEFAKKVLLAEKLANHPDFSILEQSGEIGIEAIRDFIPQLSYKPFMATKRIAVIDHAQNLNIQSSNALLKTLEEASPSTIIVLIAGSSRVLPTIISRCQVLNFSSLTKNALAEFASQNSLKASAANLELSFGSPGRLKQLAEDKEFLENEEKTVETYKKFVKMGTGDKFASITSLAELETDELEKNIRTWLWWQNGQLKQKPEDYTKVRSLTEALQGLKNNKNKKLVLQGLLLKI